MRRGAVWVAIVAALLLARWLLPPRWHQLFDFLPAAIAAAIAWLFARTLRHGRRPLIARAIAAIDGEVQLADPAVARYARRLTWIWSVYQVLLALIALWLALVPGPFGPRLFGACVLPLAVLALLLGEFFLRPRLLPQAQHHSLFAFLRALVRAWPQLLR